MSRRPQSGYGQLSPRRFASAATVCAVLLFLLFAGSIDAVPYLSGALSGALGVNGFETQLALALVLAAVAVPGQRRIRSWLGRFVSRALPLETEEVQALSTESEPAPVQRTERGTPAGSVRDNVFRKEGDYWTIVFGGAVVRLKDAKGLGYIAHLLRHPGEEFHATELMRLLGDAPATAHGRREAQVVGHDPATGSGQPLRVSDLGNAGALLDAQAKAEYKRRLDDLREEQEEAEAFNDPDRATRAREEIAFISRQVAAAVGLGGRDRVAASAAERARLAVTKCIKAALGRIGQADPDLGRHLSGAIVTGYFCSCAPPALALTAWLP